MIRLFFLVVLLFSTSVNTEQTETYNDQHLDELFWLMQGTFNSEIQSNEDPSYYNISLHMYPIWKEKGNFLYVEQAINSMQDKPYRQRIYEVTRLNDSVFKSAIYTILNDSLWIGKWKTPNAFNSLSMEDITLRDGCEVLLKRIGENHYKGETGKTSCKSSLRGASYATSEVEITEGKIISWDRGFDSENNHVC